MPDANEVWRAAELLEDFKTAPCKIKILYEEAEVSMSKKSFCFDFVRNCFSYLQKL